MGCQTRQYLQPTIPLPAFSRMVNPVAKHLHGASLGGPPGSLSPLTPSKSWAQIVATSARHQQPPPLDIKNNSFSFETNLAKPSGSSFGGGNGDSCSRIRPQSFVKLPHASTRQGKNPGRGFAGLGISTTSDAHFKSLLLRLRMALDKEKETWRAKVYAPSDVTDLTDGRQRDECIYWLGWILCKYHFSSATLALSVVLFDAILEMTSVPCGMSKLVAIVCLHVSAKFTEEEGDVPSTKDLLSIAEVDFTVKEALRMERIVLDKLHWDLNRVTPLRFLEIFHALLFCHQPEMLDDVGLGLSPTKHLERLTWKMQRLIATYQFLQFRPAALAIALLSVDLEGIDVKDWQVVTMTLGKITQMDSNELARCRKLVRLSGERKGMSADGQERRTKGSEAKSTGTKLKRKHLPSEAEKEDLTRKEGGMTMKRVFGADSPLKCKSEARGGAADRFQALQGLCA